MHSFHDFQDFSNFLRDYEECDTPTKIGPIRIVVFIYKYKNIRINAER